MKKSRCFFSNSSVRTPFFSTFLSSSINYCSQPQRTIVQLGKLQGFIAESEYDMDGGKLDVVWRRVERGSPTYVFEVQIGGDLYHAIGKLKHAHDLWNSNIYLIITERDSTKCYELLSGTFHEIKGKIHIIEVDKIQKLYELKKAYRDYETQLGIS